MPKEYTLKTLPIPNDDRITIYTVPSKKMGVIIFDGYTTQERVKKYRTKLLETLKNMNKKTI
ncbi:MAG: hypothetical protein EAZ66_04395 [Alphaproteobacteria bacterium]|nr:MAG: hypothetical protein EAZ66_04395 [Alphaproteobacteria bacterium]